MPRSKTFAANDASGLITFYEFFEPPLDSGDYTVKLEQQASGTDAYGNAFNESFSTDTSFSVKGWRFSVPPEAVQSVYPPDGAQGEFSNVLPHVLLTSNTLPWQRQAGTNNAGDPTIYPWLALLTFDQDDPIPALNAGTLQDLLTPAAGTISYPNLQLEYGEGASDAIVYIDVRAELFAAIAPSLSDMRWLAHARSIDSSLVAKKHFVNDTPAAGELSTIITNRLPAPGHKSLCCLVSLEDMASYLPGGGAPPTATIRLAVLASWSFGAIDVAITFAEYLKNVLLGAPQILYTASGGVTTPAGAALAKGYTAINHQTRQGATTVSWYRGPLLPYENAVDSSVPTATADALVDYDPSTGMFDVSLAAAWQIGRLLALADKDFATMVYNWKRTQTQAAVNQFEMQFLAGQLGIEIDARDSRPGVVKLMPAAANILRRWLEKAATR